MGRDRCNDRQSFAEAALASIVLPSAEWRNRSGLEHLIRVLGDVRFVGGCVRDTLLGVPVHDVDLATPLAPEEVVCYLREAGINAVPTGIAHGTITAVIESGTVEITTLRKDLSTDGRHATVAFTDDWREDAARRDFTINALYADPVTGAVFDYFNGLEDLKAPHVRFIGDPLQRIAEDHLRILRFFRFAARFSEVPDPEGLAACEARANDLMALSRERIRDELLKLLVAAGAVPTLTLMLSRGILKAVLPEIKSAEGLRHVVEREAALGIDPDPIRRLAAVIPNELATPIGNRLKLSNAQRRRLIGACEETQLSPAEAAYRQGAEIALDQLLLSNRPVEDAAFVRDWTVPTFPITGGAIVARGVRAGPEVNRLMRAVEDQWISEGFPDADRVNQIADLIVGTPLNFSSNA